MTIAASAAPLDAWATWLHGTGLAPRTKTAYERQARRFAAWVAEQPEHDECWLDPYRRDYAVRDYKRYRLMIDRAAPASVNLALAALDSLYAHLGLGAVNVSRAPGSRQAPRALSEVDLRAVLRAAEQRNPRTLGICMLLLHTGIRLGEVVALDLDDVDITARTGRVVVRAGKGDRPRTVPLASQPRDVLRPLVADRRQQRAASASLLLNRRLERLHPSSLDYVLRTVGAAAGVPLSAHVFRHTFATNLVRAGVDLVVVAELLGHESIETTRRYARPTAADQMAAVEHLRIDY